MNFNVYYREEICGIISSYQQDMFFVFDANCDIVSLHICRIFLKNDNFDINLGVLVPKNGRYVLKKKLPKAYISKISLNESFKAYIKCENDNQPDFIFCSHEISDTNLKNCICEHISKLSFTNYDCYTFDLNQHSPFFFDFCPTLCDFSRGKITIKTDKLGKILTK